MDRSIDFELLTMTREQDRFGQWHETPTARNVYGQISSVSASEFFAAGQNGFKPEYRLTMFGPDYQGEQLVRIGGIVYQVYRIYKGRKDSLELYLERRAGNAADDR